MLQIPRWQTALIVLVLLIGVAFASPNLISRQATDNIPDWLPNQQINLGLDLQGGSYLLLEVQTEAVIEEQLDNLVDEIRVQLRGERIGYRNLGVEDGAATFTLRDPTQAATVEELISDIGGQLQVSVGEDGKASVRYADTAVQERISNAVQQSIEIIRRRIDETGVREPTIQRQGERRVVVQLPGIDNPERMKEILGKTARLTFRLVDEDVSPQSSRIPPGSEVLPSDDETPEGTPQRRHVVRKRVMVSGENLTDAQPTFQQGQPVVSFSFDTVGAKRFADVTKNNVNHAFAIVLDGKVISAPVIREPILGGNGVISGNFTVQGANDLALLLRAGALPAPLKILEERTVGPGLGADSVRAGEFASVLALVAVIVFMAVAYGLFGILADVALVANLILIMGALSGLQATLTLPGIAGIVLTLGMAVDANVLIFERIREEAGNFRGPVSAVDAGYRRALTTIFDANITTLIAAVLLFYFGSGPVKGFAVTLAIGLVTSMFTAIMVTRLLVAGWLRRRRPQALPI
ncbi:protein translocase subunit SecD [Ferruginivarius sediminum]|uniref:Protein translocase subunit SecD n=1 Tax=Ferruginivarius sediminum TaxID=2661937 RepID=A0A369TB74_9PROT|nr:protein translocase subunit SecD [Ferruginivarius sediminum]RDD61427.1 protein translocase subunit SecD [Ferruginivarius sediminum]